MAQKDGEASVEDILRSIKQVISREDGPRRSPDTFARDAARENGEPVPERPASFSPYSFQRHSPFGARAPESAAPEPAAEEGSFDDSRSDVFDLRSLDSDAFVDDDDMEEGHVAEDATSSGDADEEDHRALPPSLRGRALFEAGFGVAAGPTRFAAPEGDEWGWFANPHIALRSGGGGVAYTGPTIRPAR